MFYRLHFVSPVIFTHIHEVFETVPREIFESKNDAAVGYYKTKKSVIFEVTYYYYGSEIKEVRAAWNTE
jgi:hypothetical protein